MGCAANDALQNWNFRGFPASKIPLQCEPATPRTISSNWMSTAKSSTPYTSAVRLALSPTKTTPAELGALSSITWKPHGKSLTMEFGKFADPADTLRIQK